MAREDLTDRTAAGFSRIEEALADPFTRWTAVVLGIGGALLLHAMTGDARWAWLGAVPAVLGGVTAGAAFGLAAASVAAVGHLVVDVVVGLEVADIPGVVVRSLALPALGVVGGVIARLEQQRDQALVRSATEDPVTGLLNVRAFYDGLRELRDEGANFSILLANVVGMHDLNERYGHPLGTDALRALGHALRRSVKGHDLVARLGSDEVAIALVGADHEGALAAAERLAAFLADEHLLLPDGTQLDVHAYFGIASYPGDATDEVALLRAADHAIVNAKERGPDEVAVTPDRPDRVHPPIASPRSEYRRTGGARSPLG